MSLMTKVRLRLRREMRWYPPSIPHHLSHLSPKCQFSLFWKWGPHDVCCINLGKGNSRSCSALYCIALWCITQLCPVMARVGLRRRLSSQSRLGFTSSHNNTCIHSNAHTKIEFGLMEMMDAIMHALWKWVMSGFCAKAKKPLFSLDPFNWRKI